MDLRGRSVKAMLRDTSQSGRVKLARQAGSVSQPCFHLHTILLRQDIPTSQPSNACMRMWRASSNDIGTMYRARLSLGLLTGIAASPVCRATSDMLDMAVGQQQR